jgi:hypothetical protein
MDGNRLKNIVMRQLISGKVSFRWVDDEDMKCVPVPSRLCASCAMMPTVVIMLQCLSCRAGREVWCTLNCGVTINRQRATELVLMAAAEHYAQMQELVAGAKKRGKVCLTTGNNLFSLDSCCVDLWPSG